MTDKYLNSIMVMCRRCSNHSECLGTGCQPKNDLMELLKEHEKLEKAFDKSCQFISNLVPKNCTEFWNDKAHWYSDKEKQKEFIMKQIEEQNHERLQTTHR